MSNQTPHFFFTKPPPTLPSLADLLLLSFVEPFTRQCLMDLHANRSASLVDQTHATSRREAESRAKLYFSKTNTQKMRFYIERKVRRQKTG